MKKMFSYFLFGALILFFAFLAFFFIGTAKQAEEISWGVNFSQKHAENLELNWKETYLALLDDLKVKNLKIAVHWDLIEPVKNEYYFEDLDWQIEQAEERGVKVFLVIGMKTPRWPECHIPKWAQDLSKEDQQESILNLIENIVLKYRESDSLWAWQVENEPLFPFGECPWVDKEFLKKEIDLVRYLDGKKPIIFTDSGEGSFWFEAAKFGDIVGTTLYKKIWFHQFGFYVRYPFPSVFYHRKARIVEKLFNKKVICVELQAEPWCPSLLYSCSIEEQKKTMNLPQFRKNIEFAKNTGFGEFYLWGSEWWYWMKTKQNQPEIWQEAGKLF